MLIFHGEVKYLDRIFSFAFSHPRLDLKADYVNLSSPNETNRLVSVLKNIPSLRALYLSNTQLTLSSLEPLMHGLSHVSVLEELDLNGIWSYDGTEMEILKVGLSNVPHLTVLRLRGVTAMGMSRPAPGIRHLTGLKELDLSHSSIGIMGDIGLESLATVLPLFTAMQVLVLESACIRGYTGMQKLLPALCHLTELVKLDIGYNNNILKDPGLQGLTGTLINLTAIRVLDLIATGISDRGVSALVKVLPHLVRLQVLDVRNDDIGDSEIISLVQTLCQSSKLDMGQNPPGDKSLTTADHCNTTLQELDIGVNSGVTAAGLAKVVQLISALPALTKLGMAGHFPATHLPDNVALALTEALPKLPVLEKLDLLLISNTGEADVFL
ncbi:protein NLRC5-like [Branchiostoma lanceolatum]|uniref:protein NLRC5-like n=1 Tax=Branchiostoma lanceolatum TaxID=7740 RepID=UPI003455D9EF